MTRISGCIAFRVMAVSNKLSPFLIEEVSICIFMTSIPRRLAANSNDVLVLVESSKNKFTRVLPLYFWLLLGSNLFSFIISSALFNRLEISSSFKSSIPNK